MTKVQLLEKKWLALEGYKPIKHKPSMGRFRQFNIRPYLQKILHK